MTVEHERLAAAGAPEDGDGLEPAGFDLLKLHLVSALSQVVSEEARDVALLSLEAGDFDEVLGEVEHLLAVNAVDDLLNCFCGHALTSTCPKLCQLGWCF